MKFIHTLLLIVSAYTVIGQSFEIDVRSNNYNDGLAQLTNLTSKFNVQTIRQALASNNHITDKNLQLDIVLYDRFAFGQHKLKDALPISPEQYIESWKSLNAQFSRGLLLFIKQEQASNYEMHSFIASQKLSDDFLLPLVVEYINARLEGNIDEVTTKLAQMLERVLVPVWNDAKKDLADQLVEEPKYQPYVVNTFHGWFKFGFFDFIPSTVEETKNMALVNAWTGSSPQNSDWFFSDKYFFTSETHLSGFSQDKIYDWGISFEKDNIKSIWIFKDAFLHNMLKYVEGTKKHSSSLKASEWDWNYNSNKNPSRYVSNIESFNARTDTNRMIVYFNDGSHLNEGDKIPKMCPSSENTYCNIFQCDLANQVLFGNVFGDIHNGPWGTNQCASGLHYRICNDKSRFIEVPIGEAWTYANKGYTVYFSAFHHSRDPNLINTQQVEGTLCSGKSGHINICLPGTQPQLIIQAGGSTGKKSYSAAWGPAYDGKVKCHMYLNYINK